MSLQAQDSWMQSTQVSRAPRVFPCALILPPYLFCNEAFAFKSNKRRKITPCGKFSSVHMICFPFLAGCFLHAQGGQSLFLVKHIPRREGVQDGQFLYKQLSSSWQHRGFKGKNLFFFNAEIPLLSRLLRCWQGNHSISGCKPVSQRCSCWVPAWGWKEGHSHHGALSPSAAERHLGQLSSPLSGGKAEGTALLHPEAPRERKEKPWGAAMPKVLHSPVCHSGSASPDSGGRAEDIPPPSTLQHHCGSFGSSVSRTWLETFCPQFWQRPWSFFPWDKYGNRVCTRSELGINSIAQIGESLVSFTCPCSSSVSTLVFKGDLLQVTYRLPWKSNSLFISPLSPSVEAVTEHIGCVCSQPGWWLLLWAAPGTHTEHKARHSMAATGSLPWTQMRWQSADLGCLYCMQRSPACRWHCPPSLASSRGHGAVTEAHALLPKGSSWLKWENPFRAAGCWKYAQSLAKNQQLEVVLIDAQRQNYALQTAKKNKSIPSVCISDSSTALSTCPCNIQEGLKGH